MNKLDRTQTIGIGLIITGFIIYFLFENSIIYTISGVLCIIGIALIFKWIPFTKKKITKYKKLLNPLVFAIIGTFLVIGSTVLNQMYISRIDEDISKREAEISSLNKRWEGNFESINRSYEYTSTGSIKHFVLKVFPSNLKNPILLEEIYKNNIQAFLERYNAANDEKLDDQEFLKWQKILWKALNGDSTSIKKYTIKTDELFDNWKKKHERLISERTQLETSIQDLKIKIIKTRDYSTMLQILGLILVLAKDIFNERK